MIAVVKNIVRGTKSPYGIWFSSFMEKFIGKELEFARDDGPEYYRDIYNGIYWYKDWLCFKQKSNNKQIVINEDGSIK